MQDIPIDCFRINPTFYEEYCNRRSLTLMEDHFEYVGFQNVKSTQENTHVLPLPASGLWLTYSKVVHKLFNTYGRRMHCASHIAVGAVILNENSKST